MWTGALARSLGVGAWPTVIYSSRSRACPGLNPGSSPFGIAPGPDGNLWFGDDGSTPAIGRIGTAAAPSNSFSFGKLKRNKRKGTAILTVIVPGPGTLALRGRGLVKQRLRGATRPASALARAVSAAGKVKLKIRSKGKKKRKLHHIGSVKVKARVTFTPTGGTPKTKAKRIKLVKRR